MEQDKFRFNIKNSVSLLIIPLLINIFSGILLWKLESLDILNFILLVVFFILLLIISFQLNKIKRLNKYSEFGFGEISESSILFDLNQISKKSKKSFYFIGVSARTVLNSTGFQDLKKMLSNNGSFEIKFLLFDYKNDMLGRERAKEETGNIDLWNSWKQIIISSVNEIIELKESYPRADISVKVYNSKPNFRFIVVDRKNIYLNFYSKDRFPSKQPALELIKHDDSLYLAFERYFDFMWQHSEEINIKI